MSQASIQARAAIADGKGNFSIEEITIHPPQSDEVLVEIHAAGICHTDYDSLSWGKTILLGHEGAGIVKQIGNDVTSIKVGDRVLLNWAIPCGHCFQCASGRTAICENNSPVTGNMSGHARLESTLFNGTPIVRSFHLGTMATHTLVRQEAVVKINNDIPFSSACLIGCGVMTGYGSVVNAAKVEAGSSVVVLGCGGVGLNAIQAAALSGATKVIAVDVDETKFPIAKKFGATHTVHATTEDAGLRKCADSVRQECDGRGADYCFESTAIPSLGDAPLAFIRNGGTAVQCSGIEQTISFDATLFEWDKIYINPLYGCCRPEVDFPRILSLYDQKKLMIDELVTTTYTLDELPTAFDDLLAGKNAKGVLLIKNETTK
ncbi:MAG: S-(hydroxymethyl)glutathione dehydrogenase/alcohol dehydrogenase [Rubritalea sp.]|jgi:S-(hydroxymethyl)glutathione dehydrogenase/alcohol dehydrogenase